MIIRKTFSFTEDDMDIIKHLEAMPKGGRSAYIGALIRADMDNSSLKNTIRQIVAEELKRGDNPKLSDTLKNIFD